LLRDSSLAVASISLTEQGTYWRSISMNFTTNIPSDFTLLEPFCYDFH
jgi:hypothetical protein